MRPQVLVDEVIDAVNASRAHQRPLDVSAVTIPVGLGGYYSAAMLRRQGRGPMTTLNGVSPCVDCGQITTTLCYGARLAAMRGYSVGEFACSFHLVMAHCAECAYRLGQCHYCTSTPWCTPGTWSYVPRLRMRHPWPPRLSRALMERSDEEGAWHDSDSDLQ